MSLIYLYAHYMHTEVYLYQSLLRVSELCEGCCSKVLPFLPSSQCFPHVYVCAQRQCLSWYLSASVLGFLRPSVFPPEDLPLVFLCPEGYSQPFGCGPASCGPLVLEMLAMGFNYTTILPRQAALVNGCCQDLSLSWVFISPAFFFLLLILINICWDP